jgi:hypothetical protein
MDGERQSDNQHGRRREWTPTSVWRAIGIVVAIAAAVVGLGFVGYVALIAVAFSSYGSNK